MYHSDIEILEGAFFVADAHCSKELRPQFLDFLRAIESGELKPTQLFLMGDLFDALFGGIPFTCKANSEGVELLKKLSKKLQIVYLEGNHDFNLQAVFKKSNIAVFPLQKQPLMCRFADKKVVLAHGDYDGKTGYKIYTAIIRNPFVLRFLNPIDTLFNHFILRFVDKHLHKKDDCKELGWFEEFVQRRFAGKEECDYWIEGHFHQNKTLQTGKMLYTNLGAFACNQRYFIVKSSQDNAILQEKIFSKRM